MRESLNIAVPGVVYYPVSFYQFFYAGIERMRRLKPCLFDFFVRHHVVPFVRVFAYRSLEIHEIPDMLLYFGAEFYLREVGIRKRDVVGLILHGVEVLDCVDERPRDVADMDIVSLEVPLEHDEEPVLRRPVDEVVYQKVHPHPRRHAEDRREPEAYGVASVQYYSLGLDLGPAVKRNRIQRRFF